MTAEFDARTGAVGWKELCRAADGVTCMIEPAFDGLTAVAEAIGAEATLSSGAKENDGILRLLKAMLCTGPCELPGRAVALLSGETELLICDGTAPWLVALGGVADGIRVDKLGEDAAGTGVGVKNEVDNIVWASCVASGFPFGSMNVIADIIRVITVC